MAAAFVQSAQFPTDFQSHSSIAITFASNITAGNCVICGVFWTNTTNTVTGASGSTDTYTVNEVNFTGGGSTIVSARMLNSVGGYKTVTITFNASFNATQMGICHEVSGVTAVDTNHANRSTPTPPGTDNVTSGAFTTTANGDYIFGFTTDGNGQGDTLAAGTNYTIRESYTGSSGPMASEDRIQSSSGSISATFSDSTSGNFPGYLTFGFGLKPPAAGSLAFEDDTYNASNNFALIQQPEPIISVF